MGNPNIRKQIIQAGILRYHLPTMLGRVRELIGPATGTESRTRLEGGHWSTPILGIRRTPTVTVGVRTEAPDNVTQMAHPSAATGGEYMAKHAHHHKALETAARTILRCCLEQVAHSSLMRIERSTGYSSPRGPYRHRGMSNSKGRLIDGSHLRTDDAFLKRETGQGYGSTKHGTHLVQNLHRSTSIPLL